MGDTHSWTRRPLGSFCEIKGGKRLPKGDGFATNKTAYPYIRVTDFGNFTVDVAQLKYLRADTQAAISRYIITKDDVYISIAGTTAVVGMVPEELNGANLTENAARVVINCRDAVLPRYLMFFLASELAQDYLKSQTLKNAQPKLALVRIKSIPVPVPPVAEQRQIARLLSAVQRAIERQERLIALTAELKKALMHKLFTEGTRGEPLKQTKIGPVPESWALERCDDLCEEISVGVVVRPRSYYVETGIPAFRSLNVREDRLETDDLVYFSKEVNDGTLYKSKLRAGDVLIVRTGYPGTSCVVPPEYDGSNCIDIVFARPSPRITSAYLSRFFNSDSGKIQAAAAKHGLAQQHLNVGAVKRVQVPLPTLEEQCAIVEALATVDTKHGVHVRAAQMFRLAFHTLLHQLMTAQIRVHDLDLSALDEPAVEPAEVA